MPAITDWDDAYANGPHIPDAQSYPPRWATAATAFRGARDAGRRQLDQVYGPGARQRFDLFLPGRTPHGLVVFVHGGYWMAFDKSSWSHLAEGPLTAGWAVALPSYTLCPEARISGITREIAQAIAVAARAVDGPIRLAGHSAGGHLVTRMACTDTPIDPAIQARIDRVLSISGLHDLRPLLRTKMNETLGLDEEEAMNESAALGMPVDSVRLLCRVGALERPEFRRQNALLANIWRGLGNDGDAGEAAGRHHFDVIEELQAGDSVSTEFLTATS